MTRSILTIVFRLAAGGAAGLLLILLLYFALSSVFTIRHTRKSASDPTSSRAAR